MLSPSSSSFSTAALPLAALLTLVLCAVYRWLVYPLFLSPLSHIPNAHWSAAISPFWILHARRYNHENGAVHKAHQRLGPIVRLGPNDVSIDSPEYVRAVYVGGYDKTDWYSVFNNYGVPCMFTNCSTKEHALRKRMISHVYSKSYINSSPAVAAQTRAILLGRLLPILEASARQSPPGIDVFPLFFATSMDSIAAYVFGLQCGTDFLRQTSYRAHWLQLYLSRHGAPFFSQELPRFTKVMRRCGISPYPRWVDWANQELGQWCKGLCENATQFLEGKTTDKNRLVDGDHPEDEPTVMRAYLAGLAREEATNGPASILYSTAIQQQTLSVQSELFDHVLAGHETTGIALTYLAWHLSRRPDVQKLLRDELATCCEPPHRPDATFLPEAKALEGLPVLNAIIMETLRLHAPIPGPQPRLTPPNGCRIGPYELPGGVRIAAGAHTLHRDARVFPDPETWDHRRWLGTPGSKADSDEEKAEAAARARSRQFWAFSSGGRMCVGSNFALHEMKMVTAMIYSRFSTHVVDDDGMEQSDSYTARPSKEQLYLRFEPVEY